MTQIPVLPAAFIENGTPVRPANQEVAAEHATKRQGGVSVVVAAAG
jgi:hypothetical protein